MKLYLAIYTDQLVAIAIKVHALLDAMGVCS
jgi:hypothetical protein